jgi:hypothetical protein
MPGVVQNSRTSQRRVETLSLCQLTREWKEYDHKTVRIDATYATGAESYEVYDTNCLVDSDSTAWVEFPLEIQKATQPEIMDRMNRLLRLDSRVRIVVVGEFDGPKKVDVPPNTPQGVADLMRSVNSRYGHQNHWNFEFVFSRIEKVEPVPASDPWSRETIKFVEH